MSISARYSHELHERAVRMVFDRREDYKSERATVTAISTLLGISPETLRGWVRRIHEALDYVPPGEFERRVGNYLVSGKPVAIHLVVTTVAFKTGMQDADPPVGQLSDCFLVGLLAGPHLVVVVPRTR